MKEAASVVSVVSLSEPTEYYEDTLQGVYEDAYDAYNSHDKTVFRIEEEEGKFVVKSRYTCQSPWHEELYGEYDSEEEAEEAILEYKKHLFNNWYDNCPFVVFDSEEEAKEFIDSQTIH